MNVNSLIEDKFIKDSQGHSLNRRERDRLLRQADILRAAEHVFALKGYYEATIADIAKEAQYATGTVYLYFKDKDALYLSLVEQKYNGLLTILKEETDKVKSSKEKIQIFVSETISFFQRNQNFFRIFISEGNKSHAIKMQKLHKLPVIMQHKEFVIELIRLGQLDKIIRDDFTAKQIADILASILMSVVFNWLKDETKGSGHLSPMSGFILDMFLNGAGRNK